MLLPYSEVPGVIHGLSSFSKEKEDIYSGGGNFDESLIQNTPGPKITRVRCWSALLRSSLYEAEKDRPFHAPRYRIIRGVEPPANILPDYGKKRPRRGILIFWIKPHFLRNAYCDAHICAIGGMDANVMPALKSHVGKETYGKFSASLATCLKGMKKAYAIKRNGANAESESEFRSTTSISAKRPFKTALPIIPSF